MEEIKTKFKKSFFDLIKELRNERVNMKIKITGNSMAPFLSKGEEIIITPYNNNIKLKNGIIVLAETDKKKAILHRITKIHNDYYIIRGDNNIYSTETIKDSDIIGIATHIVRNNKVVSLYTPTKLIASHLWQWSFLRKIYHIFIYILKKWNHDYSCRF